MSDELLKAFQGAVFSMIDYRGRPATIGRNDGTVFFTAEDGTQYKHLIWVTFTDDSTQLNETVVNRNGVTPVPQMPIVVQNIRGIPSAVLIKSSAEMDTYTNHGTSYPAEEHSHYLEGPNPDYVEGLRYMPGVVHPSTPPALTVYIEPVFYRYKGVEKAWEGGTSGSLSAYVPVVDDGRIHFVILALDRSDNSVDIIDGADVLADDNPYFPANAVVTYDDILAVAVAEKYWPLAVVELTYGLTAVKVKHITFDRRNWAGEAAGAGGTRLLFSQTVDKTVANTVTPTDLFSTGIGSVTIPANTFEVGTAVRLYMTGHISTTGTPTIEYSVELGGSELASTGAHTLGSGITNVGWRLFADIVCRAFPVAGSFVISGFIRIGDDLPGLVNISTTTLDLASALQLEVLAEWGTADAANTITCQTAIIELYPVAGL